MAGQSNGERRTSPRLAKTYPVDVQVSEVKLIGPSANLSSEGVYFVAEGDIPVVVHLEIKGKKESIAGRVVRVGSIKEKTLGIAVQFDKPLPDEWKG